MTGTEVLTGRIADQNGPWLSDQLLRLGVDVAHITICGDRPADLTAQLRFLAEQGVDLIVTSGGLGPTADDLTVPTVAEFCDRELLLDPELEEHIAGVIRRFRPDTPDLDAGRRASVSASSARARRCHRPAAHRYSAGRGHPRDRRRSAGTDHRHPARTAR